MALAACPPVIPAMVSRHWQTSSQWEPGKEDCGIDAPLIPYNSLREAWSTYARVSRYVSTNHVAEALSGVAPA